MASFLKNDSQTISTLYHVFRVSTIDQNYDQFNIYDITISYNNRYQI